MSEQKIFYKMRHAIDDQGIVVITKELMSVHESPCWYWCVEKRELGYIKSFKLDGETLLQAAKRIRYKIYKVAKSGSRVAFDTLPKAFDHLMFLKRKQIGHMKRELEILEEFTKKADGIDIESIKPGSYGERVIPDTFEVVNDNYLFD